MNAELAKAFTAALSVSSSNQQRNPAWESLSANQWEKALAWLDLSGLTLYFRERLRQSGMLDTLPAAVRERIDRCASDNRSRSSSISNEFLQLHQALRAANVEHLLLKGISLVHDYCPELALRTQYDHDLLVREHSLGRVAEALAPLGYRRKESGSAHPVVFARPDPRLRFSRNFEALYSPRLGREIEVHFELWESGSEEIEIDLPNDMFSRAAKRSWAGAEYFGLSDEDALMFQVLHSFRHILRNWCRLAVFLEIACFLNRRSADRAFWAKYMERIRRMASVPEATLVVFGLAERLFDAPVPEEIRQNISAGARATLMHWLDRYGSHSALANFRGDKYSLFLHRQFVRDPAGWARIQRLRLFPMHRPHRPSAIVFQRGFSRFGKWKLESIHALRRVRSHAVLNLRYAWQYPQWALLTRRLRLAERGAGVSPPPKLEPR